jgi:predicted acylesterase/phospholipase RssA
MSIPEAIEFILTSCAMPAVFNPMLLDGQTLIDGGTVVNLDVVSVVNQCREIVDNDEDIILDVILNFNGNVLESF